MRTSLLVAACGLLVAGCSGTSQAPADAAMAAVPPPNVAFYTAAPAGAAQLGPIKVSMCDGTRSQMTRKILEEAARLGGNGVTQLACRDEGVSAACWRTPVCEGVAINVPPPPPPPTLKKRGVKRG